jgi:RNA ligase (TIGR02306 family)
MSTDTEFCCEVVRVTEILPHPNADRLEIAHFETGAGPSAYTTIIQRGAYKVGSFACYLGPDCLVKKGTPGCDFLFERLDGQGKEVFRIRAARIRGVYSEGLLLPLSAAFKDGEGAVLGGTVAHRLGVEYYQKPEKGTAFPQGQDKQPLDRTLDGLFPIYTIDSLRKVPFLFTEDDSTGVEISEKIHGTNMRAGYLPLGFLGQQKFVLGSHRAIKSDTRSLWQKVKDKLTGKKWAPASFYGEDVWWQATRRYNLEHKLKSYPDLVVYFELYGLSETGARIQDLTYGDCELGLAIIDMYDADAHAWLSKQEVRAVAKDLGIPTVPSLYTGPYPGLDKVKEMAEGKSTVDPNQIREGVVVASVLTRDRGKWVSEQYRMRNEEAE